MTFLLIDKLCKRYGATEAVASSSLAIEKGEFVSCLALRAAARPPPCK